MCQRGLFGILRARVLQPLCPWRGGWSWEARTLDSYRIERELRPGGAARPEIQWLLSTGEEARAAGRPAGPQGARQEAVREERPGLGSLGSGITHCLPPPCTLLMGGVRAMGLLISDSRLPPESFPWLRRHVCEQASALSLQDLPGHVQHSPTSAVSHDTAHPSPPALHSRHSDHQLRACTLSQASTGEG